MAENKPIYLLVRGLQLLFAVIVMGLDGYAIHGYRGHAVDVNDPVFDGDATLYAGVPAAWGFLMFCAVWTFPVVIFHFFESGLASRPLLGYVGLLSEAVAVLSWFAGFIAVAVNVGTTNSCMSGQNSCAEVKAAAAFGAFAWLLFMVTAAAAVGSFFHNRKQVPAAA
ncbi:marvel domain-containing protein [Aspergillus avenaceus]|uniref:Marvel domain-containing protein n=1 Tax=Aspergillus avenaceus TaxID=36643 RepID=A0A5N6U573_ASPAV|nr:marvel domain-containing protein [Aspergillus avenaceus]